MTQGKDISVVLNTSLNNAEALKIKSEINV